VYFVGWEGIERIHNGSRWGHESGGHEETGAHQGDGEQGNHGGAGADGSKLNFNNNGWEQ